MEQTFPNAFSIQKMHLKANILTEPTIAFQDINGCGLVILQMTSPSKDALS